MKHIQRGILVPSLLKVYDGAIEDIDKILLEFNFESVVMFCGDGTFSSFGSKIEQILNNNPNIDLTKTQMIKGNNIDEIYQLAFKIPESEVVLAVGGGKVLDVAKYVGHIKRIPVITFPTSPANDSICSPLCSVFIDGKRSTISATIPFGVIADLSILKSSPIKFIYSGIGDMIAKITSLEDLKYEEEKLGVKVDEFAKLVAKNSIDSIIPNICGDVTNKHFLKSLIQSLIMSGISMEIAQNSAPASGSEHLISHSLDRILQRPSLHGIQVGIATYIIAKVQNNRRVRLVDEIFDNSGFWQFMEGEEKLNLNGWLLAIDNAPFIKPKRWTFIHSEENRKAIKEFIKNDEKLQRIFEH